MTQRNRTVEERRLDAVHLTRRVTPDRDRARRAVPLIGEVLVALQTAKIAKYVGEAPTGIAQRRPAVVHLRRASQREAGVGRRAPAHDPSSRQWDPPVQLDVSAVTPVMADRRLRRVDNVGWQGVHVPMIGARLNQHHPTTGVLAQAGGEHTTGRTPADDDNVTPQSSDPNPHHRHDRARST